MWMIGVILGAIEPAWGEEQSIPSELQAGRADGAAAARAQLKPGLALASGLGGAGLPAALGLGVGSLPTLGLPVIGALGCGAMGCASVAWAWDLADTVPAPGPWQDQSLLYQEGYLQGFEESLLRQRRRWVYLGGTAITLGLAGGYAGIAALAATRE